MVASQQVRARRSLNSGAASGAAATRWECHEARAQGEVF
jgi:hypothetical protein